jgi:hypothetical protein
VKLDCFGGLLKNNIIVECVCEIGLFGGYCCLIFLWSVCVCVGIWSVGESYCSIILLWSMCVKLEYFGRLL